MSEVSYEQPVCIGAEHPAFPGHFPGHPLVPGVMLLEHVAMALRAWRGLRMTHVLEARFMAPLLPDQIASVRLTEAAPGRTASDRLGVTPSGARIRFEIQRDGSLLARGLVEGAR